MVVATNIAPLKLNCLLWQTRVLIFITFVLTAISWCTDRFSYQTYKSGWNDIHVVYPNLVLIPIVLIKTMIHFVFLAKSLLDVLDIQISCKRQVSYPREICRLQLAYFLDGKLNGTGSIHFNKYFLWSLYT